MFVFGFVAGAALAATASWFWYTHKVASKVETAVNGLETQVAALATRLPKV